MTPNPLKVLRTHQLVTASHPDLCAAMLSLLCERFFDVPSLLQYGPLLDELHAMRTQLDKVAKVIAKTQALTTEANAQQQNARAAVQAADPVREAARLSEALRTYDSHLQRCRDKQQARDMRKDGLQLTRAQQALLSSDEDDDGIDQDPLAATESARAAVTEATVKLNAQALEGPGRAETETRTLAEVAVRDKADKDSLATPEEAAAEPASTALVDFNQKTRVLADVGQNNADNANRM
jgi:hypothetical protein